MVEFKSVTKKFNNFIALNDLNTTLKNGRIYGMVGSNGAGKSTLLRVLTGIYKTNSGNILYDGNPVYENPNVKQKFAFVPDDLYFVPGADIKRMAKLYARLYKSFDYNRFYKLVEIFKLPNNKKISDFSKGMKRQAAIILALSSMTQYIYFDETFDGLDPVMRNLVKKIIYNDVIDRNVTVIITSHSLRELEDICDNIILLHQGKIILENDTETIKGTAFKVQVAYNFDYDESLFEGLNVLNYSKNGSVANLIIKDEEAKTREILSQNSPVILDILPMTLEEIFTIQMKQLGYDCEQITEGI